jgi:hypothetical protein
VPSSTLPFMAAAAAAYPAAQSLQASPLSDSSVRFIPSAPAPAAAADVPSTSCALVESLLDAQPSADLVTASGSKLSCPSPDEASAGAGLGRQEWSCLSCS